MPTPESDPTSDLPPLPTALPSPHAGSSLTDVSSQLRQVLERTDERRERIGPYRVVKRLGEGGMGVVWLCTRDDGAMTGRVAIKLVRTVGGERETNAFLKRFETERQVLNSLNHPNIARLIDAGQLPEPDSRPYLVMEYIEGEHIDEYCDRMELSTEQRVRLFQKVCDAVQHAHQNLVVHRDIKPANVLVDSRGEPKLMDFGIAKILNVGLAGLTMATGEGRGPMTPEYASPEQVLGKPVGTASDVYALGVLLYQLLTGRRPYRLKNKALDAIAKAIVEEEPEKPSTAVTQEDVRVAWDGTSSTVAADRLAKPREGTVHRLKRKLSGDIDNIVLMAMRKSPQRRYASAAAFAEDLQRHLDGQPVKARGEGWGYVAGKMLWRNRLGAAAAAAVLVATTGAAVYSWSAYRSERAAVVAERAARAAEEKARADAEKRLVQVRELAGNYLTDVTKRIERLSGATEATSLLADTSRQLLEKLASEFPDDPKLAASLADGYANMARTLGGTREPGQGDFAAALAMLRKSIDIRRKLAGMQPSDEQTVRRLAAALIYQSDFLERTEQRVEQRESLDEAIRLMKPFETSETASTRTLAAALLERAKVLRTLREDGPADADLEQSLKMRERNYRANPADEQAERDYAIGLSAMAKRATERDDPLAEDLLRENLRLREERHSKAQDARTERDVANASGELGRYLTKRGGKSLEKAEPLLQRQLEIVKKLEKTDPSNARAKDDVVNAMMNLAALASARDATEAALRQWRDAVARAKELAIEPGADAVRRRTLGRALEALAHAEDAAGEDPRATIEDAIDVLRKLPSDTETDASIANLRKFLKEKPK